MQLIFGLLNKFWGQQSVDFKFVFFLCIPTWYISKSISEWNQCYLSWTNEKHAEEQAKWKVEATSHIAFWKEWKDASYDILSLKPSAPFSIPEK